MSFPSLRLEQKNTYFHDKTTYQFGLYFCTLVYQSVNPSYQYHNYPCAYKKQDQNVTQN